MQTIFFDRLAVAPHRMPLDLMIAAIASPMIVGISVVNDKLVKMIALPNRPLDYRDFILY